MTQKFSPIVTVVPTLAPLPTPPLLTWAELDEIREDYSAIWEKDRQWLMGRAICSEIARHWIDHDPGVIGEEFGRVNVGPALPTILDVRSCERRSIYYAVPLELRGLFCERCEMAVGLRWPSWQDAFFQYLNEPLNEMTLTKLRVVIRVTEQAAESKGLPLLWQIGAACFGITETEVKTLKAFA